MKFIYLYKKILKYVFILAIIAAFVGNPFIALIILAIYLCYKYGKGAYQKNKLSKELINSDTNTLSPYEYELFVAEHLRLNGCKNVDTTPQSGDFGADVIAYDSEGYKICIQCKKYTGPVGVKAVQEIIAAKQYYKCQKAYVYATSSFTPQAVKMAEETGTGLVILR